MALRAALRLLNFPKSEVESRLISVVKGFDKVEAEVDVGSHFTNDLGLDSLDVVEVVMAFEQEFGIEIPDTEADKIATVQDAIDYVSSHPSAQ